MLNEVAAGQQIIPLKLRPPTKSIEAVPRCSRPAQASKSAEF
jgi:hypothetical protein